MKRVLVWVLLILSLPLFSCSTEGHQTDRLLIDVLDVGKADCIVIRHKEFVGLIDTAEADDFQKVCAFLQSQRIRKIDFLILTHFDKDHVGGAAELLEQFEVLSVYQSAFSHESADHERYLAVAEKKGLTPICLTENFSFSFGDCQMTICPPKKSSYPKKESNNSSLFVTLLHQKNSFGFFGDAMEDRLKEILEDAPFSFDTVKIPYHGNYLENYPDFLDKISFSKACITCSDKNPADEKTLDLLKENEISVYQTKNGSIRIASNGKSVSVSQP